MAAQSNTLRVDETMEKRCGELRRQIISVMILTIIICQFHVIPHANAKQSSEQAIVDAWASKFGEELNWLAKNMTKADEIKKQYKENSARVEKKGDLIQDAVKNVGRMFQKKTVAVRCIAKKAEELAENFNKTSTNETKLQFERDNFKYHSSKYSMINGVPCENRSETKIPCSNFDILKNATATYLHMWLQRDKHFYNISVNTTHTSVHVPTNVFDGSNDTKDVLMWSAGLDGVFVNNSKSDPALSWQYFGSETGVLRHFPAKSWEDRDTSSTVDVYDCRKRSWYIETATCSKDIVILLDRTGSMYGYLGFLAKLTIKSLLDTFSNNDFFNIYTFSGNVTPLVKCFEGDLVQATPENINMFNDQMSDFKKTIDGYANETSIENATIEAFKLLKKYRAERKCNENPCNQAIMLITDNIQGNFTDIFEEYNRENDKIPVRIFTYLLGKDQSNVAEMKSIACSNRGAFSHIQTLDEVQEKVLDYVSTIALPLVLQGVKHPPTWTHAFKDVTYRDEEYSDEGKRKKNPPPRLMIAVGVPAYKIITVNETREYTGLLGVASTDVPVEDIDKLTLPYKLGVNAYPFIVSNNGYVLLHPDLRPMETFKLKELEELDHPQCKELNKTEDVDCVFLKNNYNSIDFTEVEQIDEHVNVSETKSRPPIGRILNELRDLSLSHTIEKKLNVSVRFHYDKMRRVSEEKYDYYFAPLNSTPFTLGLAIPSKYGQTAIKVGDEIGDHLNKNLSMTDYFRGQNWKVHPDWVYCKFHYMDYQSFNSSEQELLYFVQTFSNKTWTWSDQYSDESEGSNEDEENPKCDQVQDKIAGYYCNKELVELLVFDARVTNTSYGTWEFEDNEELIASYNATLRFVATMSGLTRWQFIYGEDEKEGDKEFGDYYTRAIDETWYKSAVLQHEVDNESFVYSVPHDDKDDIKEEGDVKVMASHAIFRMDAGKEAPGCVVGFQFEQNFMYKRFISITKQHDRNCDGCLQCNKDHFACYVIDNNGYILLSNETSDTGRFFGEVQVQAMRTLVKSQIFKEITVYDYQAVCKISKYQKNETQTPAATSFATTFITPYQLLKSTVQWIAMETILFMGKINIWAWAEEDVKSKTEKAQNPIPEPYILEPCDKKANLYVMQQNFEDSTNTVNGLLYFSRIQFSNLLLVVVHENMTKSANDKLKAELEKIEYSFNSTHPFPCHKKELNKLRHRRLDDCFTEDCREYEMNTCSSSHMVQSCLCILLLLIFLNFIAFI